MSASMDSRIRRSDLGREAALVVGNEAFREAVDGALAALESAILSLAPQQCQGFAELQARREALLGLRAALAQMVADAEAARREIEEGARTPHLGRML